MFRHDRMSQSVRSTSRRSVDFSARRPSPAQMACSRCARRSACWEAGANRGIR